MFLPYLQIDNLVALASDCVITVESVSYELAPSKTTNTINSIALNENVKRSVTNHKNSVSAHTSTNITNNSNVVGAKVTDALNALKIEYDFIDGESEVSALNGMSYNPLTKTILLLANQSGNSSYVKFTKTLHTSELVGSKIRIYFVYRGRRAFPFYIPPAEFAKKTCKMSVKRIH